MNPRILYTSREAAEYLGVSESTLVSWRHYNTQSLKWIKVGRLVRYRKIDLERWLRSRERRSIWKQK